MKNDIVQLRQNISKSLKFGIPRAPESFVTHERVEQDGYHRLRISYTDDEGEQIPAFLLLPHGTGPFGAVLVHHQHHHQWHFGKSEVCGLVGDPWQALGPALARQGIVVLAPDSLCFEDRRHNHTGTEPDHGDAEQYFNEMSYRLVRGDTLMRKLLSDSALGISLLRSHPLVNPKRIGILGHSFGGNTVLFHGALDKRIRFACSSGAACSYKYKIDNRIGIEIAEIIPGFYARFDIPDLAACFEPRRLLVVSATEDKYSQDAEEIIAVALEKNPNNQIEHKRYYGGHALTQQRFDDIVRWIADCAHATPSSRDPKAHERKS